MASLLGWSQLPEELLDLIFLQLPYTDCLRFAAVCPSWQSAAAQRINGPLPPLLMLKSRKDEMQLFALWQGQFHKLAKSKMIPLPRQGLIPSHGSSRGGWLVIENAKESENLLLLNPIEVKEIKLPPLDFRVYAAALSSAPVSGEDCVLVVMGYSSAEYKMASCRPNDCRQGWRFLTSERGYIDSMVFHKGELYCLMLGSIEVYGFDPCLRRRATLTTDPAFYPRYTKLVESNGELLMVMKHDDHTFSLCKHQAADGRWVEVKSLGDHVLLLTHCGSESFCAEDFKGTLGSKGNCIYYSDGDSVVYIYSLEDERQRKITTLSVPDAI